MSKKTTSRQVNKGERARLRRKKEARREKIEELQEDMELMKDVEEPVEEQGATEEVEKEYSMMEMPFENSWMMGGPTSFEELDAQRQAQEKADKVRHVTWDTQDLVSNILRSYDLEPTEKADRIMDVADGFAERVNSMMSESEDMQKDIDQLQIEAILATYHRSLNPIQKAADWAADLIVKRDLTYKARKRLGDSDFALPSKRKYPIHDKAHVRNALARAAQMIARGGEAAADAKAALPKIRAAAKKFGIEVSKGAILVEKDQKGDWRWIGKPSNNFLDWQGDIMSKSAHAEYVNFLDQNPDMAPVFMTWHVPGTARQSPVDFWMEHEGALIMSGKLTEGEAAALLHVQKDTELGMSVQGLALRNPQERGVIEHYWLYEVSDLPLEKAANPFTSLETIAKEAGMDKLEYLTEMMGSKEKAEDFLKKTGQMQKELADAGLTSKEKETETSTPETAPETPAAPAAEKLDANLLTKQIVDAVGKEFDFEGLNAFVAKAQENDEKVQLLEAMLKDLQKEKEAELVEMLTPPIQKWSWSQATRPSARKDTILKENDPVDEKLKKAAPEISKDMWLSEVTGTVPVMED